MSNGEMLYLALAIGAAAVFAITLAWVSRSPLGRGAGHGARTHGSGREPSGISDARHAGA